MNNLKNKVAKLLLGLVSCFVVTIAHADQYVLDTKPMIEEIFVGCANNWKELGERDNVATPQFLNFGSKFCECSSTELVNVIAQNKGDIQSVKPHLLEVSNQCYFRTITKQMIVATRDSGKLDITSSHNQCLYLFDMLKKSRDMTPQQSTSFCGCVSAKTQEYVTAKEFKLDENQEKALKSISQECSKGMDL